MSASPPRQDASSGAGATGHTPGPWKQSKDLGQAVVLARGVMVADCNIFGGRAPSEAQCAANARMMAAAPEMFVALSNLLAAYVGLAELVNEQDDGGDPEDEDVVKRARAILRRAQGDAGIEGGEP